MNPKKYREHLEAVAETNQPPDYEDIYNRALQDHSENRRRNIHAISKQEKGPNDSIQAMSELITGGESCKSPKALRKHLMDNAGVILDEYMNAALGRKKLESTSSDCREKIWKLIEQVIVKQQSEEFIEIEIDSIPPDKIGTPEGIIHSVLTGKCSVQGAEKLLEMYARAKEIEIMGQENAPPSTFPFINFIVRSNDGSEKTYDQIVKEYGISGKVSGKSCGLLQNEIEDREDREDREYTGDMENLDDQELLEDM